MVLRGKIVLFCLNKGILNIEILGYLLDVYHGIEATWKHKNPIFRRKEDFQPLELTEQPVCIKIRPQINRKMRQTHIKRSHV